MEQNIKGYIDGKKCILQFEYCKYCKHSVSCYERTGRPDFICQSCLEEAEKWEEGRRK